MTTKAQREQLRYNEIVGSPENFRKNQSLHEPASLEQKIEHHLDSLPPDLRRTWSQRLEKSADADLPELEDELDRFLARREKVLLGKAPEIFRGMNHRITDQTAINKTLETIRDAEGRPDLYVGEGKTAHVYRDPYTKALCYKFVNNFREYEAWNNVDHEAHFLEDLGDLNVDGVRVPHLTGVIDLPDIKVIGMEYLDAVSIDSIMRRDRQLPENFDMGNFFKRLRAYVAAMHERNIYHRDLHEGNVLIGRDGTPYVIDFGKAVYSPSPEFAYEAYDRTGTNRVILNSDENWIYALETKFSRYLMGKSVKVA